MRAWIGEQLEPSTLARASEFCLSSAGYCYLQDPDWPALWSNSVGRHRYLHAIVTRDDGSIFAYGALRRTRLAGGYALGAFRRGPVTARPADLAPALDALLPELRRRGFVAVSVNPRWEDDAANEAEDVIAAAGGHVARPQRQRLHSRTGLIDLTDPPEEIFARCDAHARRQLRKIDKLGLTVRPVDRPGDLDLFERWYGAFCADRGLDRRGLPSLWAQQDWIASKGGDCALVEADGEAIGAFTLLRDGPRILNLSVAWADPKSKLPRSYMVYWFAIRRYGGKVAAGGPRWIDCAGRTDPRIDRSDFSAEGRERFKTGFPQRQVDLTRVHQLPLRPILFRALDAVERQFA